MIKIIKIIKIAFLIPIANILIFNLLLYIFFQKASLNGKNKITKKKIKIE